MFKRFNITLSLVLSFVLVFSTSVFAAGNNPKNFKLDQNEIERLVSFGFSDKEIGSMTLEEYEGFNSKFGADTKGEVVSVETTYYRVNNKGGVTEISKKQAEKEVKDHKEKKQKQEQTLLASDPIDTETTSWMTMTTTSSSLGKGEYLLKNSFTWLYKPFYELTDVLGMTFNSNLTYIQNSEYAVYTRDYASASNPPSESEYLWTADHKSANSGIAFDIDLKSASNNKDHTTTTHRGYMVFRVSKNNSSATSTNAYGHYSHLWNTISFSVSFPAGMSISGVTMHDDMTDTGISWNI